MKKAILGVAAAFAVAIVAVVVLVAVQPADGHVERHVILDVETMDVWPFLADVGRQQQWSPWSVRDPEMVKELSDNTEGVGAWYSWSGNDEVGEGRMEIIGVEPGRSVTSALSIVEPFALEATVVYALEPVEGGLKVIWGRNTTNGTIGKAFGLLMDMDTMLGSDLESGLAMLAPLATAARDARQAAERLAEEAAAAEAEGTEAGGEGSEVADE